MNVVQVVFNNFLYIDVTNRSKNSSDQKRLFFANTPFKGWDFFDEMVLCNQGLAKVKNLIKEHSKKEMSL